MKLDSFFWGRFTGVVLLLFALGTLLALVLLYASCAHAEPPKDDPEENVLPFELRCPDTKQCLKGQQGMWAPSWYLQDVAAELTVLRARLRELEKAEVQLDALRTGLRASEEHVEALHREIIHVEQWRAALERDLVEQKRKKDRRLRWAIGSTIAAAALAGVLGVVVAK